MNINFDDNTKNVLKDNLNKKNKDAVRFLVKGFGWAGPTFGVVLDEQHENDVVNIIDGIKFVAEDEIAYMFEDVNLIYKKSIWGDNFEILLKSRLNSRCPH